MRDLAALSFITLDGVMQAPTSPDEDPSGGFRNGGWAAPYWDGVMPHVEATAMAAPYDILLGRKTYDLFAAHWPSAEASTISDRLNAARKHVATATPLSIPWKNSRALSGDLADAVRQLKAGEGPLLQIHGSAHLIGSLLRHDLIDEFRIWMFPVVVGGGKRLFEGKAPPASLRLTASHALPNGVVSLVYRTER
ncbi:MAG: dihydrofolate reductase family protein [Pseudomonadota bacterium]